jgi:hypothetical protein
VSSVDEVRTVLLAVRLVGSATDTLLSEAVGRLGGSVADAATLLSRLELAGLVEQRSGRWRLTSDGRAEGERLLQVERDDLGATVEVTAGYQRFLTLNGPLLRICTDWQLKDADPSSIVPNDHADNAYDRAVLERLVALHRRALPVCEQLASGLPRLASYGTRLSAALRRIVDGDHSAVDGPAPDSYHGTWFELHENLIATLGLDRSTEPLPDTTTPFPS